MPKITKYQALYNDWKEGCKVGGLVDNLDKAKARCQKHAGDTPDSQLSWADEKRQSVGKNKYSTYIVTYNRVDEFLA